MVPTATTNIEMIEITLMKFRFFPDQKYRFAMKDERFNPCFLRFRLPLQVVCEGFQ